MADLSDRVGEVIEASTTEFVAQCYELYQSPPLGSLVKTGDQLVEQYEQEHNVPAIEIAAALAKMVQGETPLLLSKEQRQPRPQHEDRFKKDRGDFKGKSFRGGDDRGDFKSKGKPFRGGDEGMETYRLDVGRNNDVQPGNIVGAIANEANLESRNIGRIKIFDDYSLVDLPEGLPADIIGHLKGVRVGGQKLNLSKQLGVSGGGDRTGFKRKGPPKGKEKKPHRKGGKPE